MSPAVPFSRNLWNDWKKSYQKVRTGQIVESYTMGASLPPTPNFFLNPQCPSYLLHFAVPLDLSPLCIGFSALPSENWHLPLVAPSVLSKLSSLLTCGALCHRQHSPCPAEPHPSFISVMHGHSFHSWKGGSLGTTTVGPS